MRKVYSSLLILFIVLIGGTFIFKNASPLSVKNGQVKAVTTINNGILADTYLQKFTNWVTGSKNTNVINTWSNGVYCIRDSGYCDFTIERDVSSENAVPVGYKIKWRYKFDDQSWTDWMYEFDDLYHVYYPFEETGTHNVRVVFETEPKGYKGTGLFEIQSQVWVGQ